MLNLSSVSYTFFQKSGAKQYFYSRVIETNILGIHYNEMQRDDYIIILKINTGKYKLLISETPLCLPFQCVSDNIYRDRNYCWDGKGKSKPGPMVEWQIKSTNQSVHILPMTSFSWESMNTVIQTLPIASHSAKVYMWKIAGLAKQWDCRRPFKP